MKILITGTAGFIGAAVAIKILNEGHQVIGIDNHNDYYDVKIKEDRLKRIHQNPNYIHYREDICDAEKLKKIFEVHKPERVVHLAAQAGVRYSIENPSIYIKSNVFGFLNILENCKYKNVKHLIYASTSSVYGANTKLPFKEFDETNHPLSIYAATKKSNELMAHTYSLLYNLPITGLRFFTVYGPWGRPDMALFKFTKSMIENKQIDVYNYGNHSRDFTYIDDVVDSVSKILFVDAKPNNNWNSNNPDPSSSIAPWKIYNLGNSQPVKLMTYIKVLEKILNKKAVINFLPLQEGDIADTFADNSKLVNEIKFKPKTSVEDGIKNFINWFLDYYNYEIK